jgi:hypothetical protein
MTKYNVITFKNMVTVNRVQEGLSDRMWTAGCRITHHDLTAEEVRSKIVDSAFTHDHIEWAKLVELVTQDDQDEPGKAWKNLREPNKWDNEKNPPPPIY